MKSDHKPNSTEQYFDQEIKKLQRGLRAVNSRPTIPIYYPDNIPDDIMSGEYWINANTGVLSYAIELDGDIVIKEVTATNA